MGFTYLDWSRPSFTSPTPPCLSPNNQSHCSTKKTALKKKTYYTKIQFESEE